MKVVVKVDDIDNDIEKIIKNALDKARVGGILEGLKVAEQICNWLTVQPQSKKIKEIRRWSLELIEKTKNDVNDFVDKLS